MRAPKRHLESAWHGSEKRQKGGELSGTVSVKVAELSESACRMSQRAEDLATQTAEAFRSANADMVQKARLMSVAKHALRTVNYQMGRVIEALNAAQERERVCLESDRLAAEKVLELEAVLAHARQQEEQEAAAALAADENADAAKQSADTSQVNVAAATSTHQTCARDHRIGLSAHQTAASWAHRSSMVSDKLQAMAAAAESAAAFSREHMDTTGALYHSVVLP